MTLLYSSVVLKFCNKKKASQFAKPLKYFVVIFIYQVPLYHLIK